MSATLEGLRAQIASGEDLSSIVRTMKALAATSVRQYEKAAESLDDYFYTIELGLSVVLSSYAEIPADPALDRRRPVLLLVFGSDYGLAGRFNEEIVSYALTYHWGHQEEAALSENRITAAAGEQAVNRLRAAGVSLADRFSMPTSISAITPFVQLLLERIERLRSQEGVERALLIYNRPAIGGFSPRTETLLPISLARLRETRFKWQSRSLPTFSMSPDRLLPFLLRQYFFVSLYRATALSLAAENSSRLTAMQAAEKSIGERLGDLKMAFQQERQAVITGELLDIISGFKTVRDRQED